MNNSQMFKKAMSFLTLAVLSASATGCSNTEGLSEMCLDSEEEVSASENITPDESKLPEANSLSSKKANSDYSSLFSDRDKNPDFENITAEINLEGDSASCDNNGVSVSGSAITIKEEGIYRISGKLSDGQIIVDAPDAKVQLILDNADISCSNSAAIYGVNSKKIFVSLAKDSVNTLSDGSSYNNEEADACIFSKDSLTINGSGTLNVKANFEDGIHSKDDIVITGGNINITSVGDGIKGKDYTAVCGGNITVESGQDGIKSNQDNDKSLGFVYIEGGNFSIDAEQDGIQAETALIINGGTFDIKSGGGSENSTKTHNDMEFGGRRGNGFKGFGGRGDFPNNDSNGDFTFTALANTTADTNDSDTTVSTKGLKSGTSLIVNGGVITVDSADDALHSNGTLEINGGSAILTAGDDGIHSTDSLTISGGDIDIKKSYEGIEATVINITGGDISLKASDDGLNASDGVTSQGGMGTYTDSVQLNISGGTVYVDADGDGLDSNGSMTISGGTVLVDGPVNGGNGALDSNGEIIINGGIVVAAGSSQMAEAPSEKSAQYSVSASIGSSQQAGTLVTLIDENDKEILSFAPSKTFDHIVISSPNIEKGRSYTLSLGGKSASVDDHGLFNVGGYDGRGTSVGSFTANSTVSYIGSQSGMGGGFGGGRGNRQPGDFQLPTNENGEPEIPEMPDGGFGDRGFGRHGGKFNGGFGNNENDQPFGNMQPPMSENGMPEPPDGMPEMPNGNFN